MNKILVHWEIRSLQETLTSEFTFFGLLNKTTFVWRFAEIAINNQIADIPNIGFFASRLTRGCCSYLTLTGSFLLYITFTQLVITAHISAVRKRNGITKASFVKTWVSIHINSTCTVYLRWFEFGIFETQIIWWALSYLFLS